MAETVLNAPTQESYVLKRALTNPVTIVSFILGVLCGILLASVDFSTLFLVGLIVFVVVAFGSFILDVTTRKVFFLEDWLKIVKTQMKQRQNRDVHDLRLEIAECGRIPGTTTRVVAANNQFRVVERVFGKIDQVLAHKYKTGEIKYGKFLAAAEGLSKAILSHLRQIVTLLQSLGALQPNDKRLEFLERLTSQTPQFEAERDRLRQQAERKTRVYIEVDRIITENETAIGALETMLDKIASTPTDMVSAADFADLLNQVADISNRLDTTKHEERTDDNG